MKKYTDYALTTKRKNMFDSHWTYKEGVFLTPRGKYIARIYKHPNNYQTISQHDKEEDAIKAYNEYYLNKNK